MENKIRKKNAKFIPLILSFLFSSVVYAGIVAPSCGEFTPFVGKEWKAAPHHYVHFFPKNCNQILIGDKLETILPGVGVFQGGLLGDTLNACIDKQCGNVLAPNTIYRVYLFMQNGKMTMDFSLAESTENPKYGNQVKSTDHSEPLIGMIYTDKNSWVGGGSAKLDTLSWFNKGWTGLTLFLDNIKVCSDKGLPQIVPNAFVEFLIFGINDTFRQGYTVPNVEVTATVRNDTVGKRVIAGIAIERGGYRVTITNGKPAIIHRTHYGLPEKTPIIFSSTGNLPTGLNVGIQYYIKRIKDDLDNFHVTTTPGGETISTIGPDSGNHTFSVPPTLASSIDTYYQNEVNASGSIHPAAVGAWGAEEGYVRAYLMLGTPDGGCAELITGQIYTTPHHS